MNTLNARLIGEAPNDGKRVRFECPGHGFHGPCEAETEVELTNTDLLVFPDTTCPMCGTDFRDRPVNGAIRDAVLYAIDNYDGPPDDSDAWSGGFARNH